MKAKLLAVGLALACTAPAFAGIIVPQAYPPGPSIIAVLLKLFGG